MCACFHEIAPSFALRNGKSHHSGQSRGNNTYPAGHNCYVVCTFCEVHLKWSLKGCWFTWLLFLEISSTVQDAKAQLQHVLAKDPSNGHAWHTLGQMAEETGDLQEAAHCYTEGAKSSGRPSYSPQSLFLLCVSVLIWSNTMTWASGWRHSLCCALLA